MLASARLAVSSRLSPRMHSAAMAFKPNASAAAELQPACGDASPSQRSSSSYAARSTLWEKLLHGNSTGRKRRAADAATAAGPSTPSRQAHTSCASLDTDSDPQDSCQCRGACSPGLPGSMRMVARARPTWARGRQWCTGLRPSRCRTGLRYLLP